MKSGLPFPVLRGDPAAIDSQDYSQNKTQNYS
jgi:hypothetical protein